MLKNEKGRTELKSGFPFHETGGPFPLKRPGKAFIERPRRTPGERV
jgi:hypothetical protein